MRKTYILDTNILIATNGEAIFGFDDNEVVVTHITLEELDKKKKAPAEVGYGARQAANIIRDLRANARALGHKYADGIPINEEKGLFRIEMNHIDNADEILPKWWDRNNPDNLIITATKNLAAELDHPVSLVSNDTLMWIKADAIGIDVQTYHNDQIDSDKLYMGRIELQMDPVFINAFHDDGEISVDTIDPDGALKSALHENEYVWMHNGTQSALARYNNGVLHSLNGKSPFSVTPKNQGQRFAIDALLAPASEIPLVILKGAAGTGKTYLSIASGLEKTYTSQRRDDESAYDSIIITRSNTSPEDEDLGALPGTLEEKMSPLLAPFYDNMKSLMRKNSGEDRTQIEMHVEDLFADGVVEITALQYIRGRSFINSYIIVDEAQNMSRNQIKTLVSRCGLNTKLIVMGDPDQIDTPKLSKRSNGLVYLSEKMKNSPLCAQVTFLENECVRSPLAAEAVRLL